MRSIVLPNMSTVVLHKLYYSLKPTACGNVAVFGSIMLHAKLPGEAVVDWRHYLNLPHPHTVPRGRSCCSSCRPDTDTNTNTNTNTTMLIP